MKFLIAEKLSSHKFKTPEGYLVCVDSVLSRTGKQTYKKNEVFADSDDETEIEVDRKESEVFSDEALASFENKPITIEHPNEDVNTSNHNELAVGFVRDIHRGKIGNNDVMLGTLVITDQDAINMVESGELTDLSCGYDCDIVDDNGYQQTNIRGNHVALCEQGRAGIARIVDSVKDAVLPASIKKDIQRILAAKSTYTKYDLDVSDIIKEIERYCRIDGHPITFERQSIKGWFKTEDGMMRKDYIFTIKGFSNRILISMYANPDTWKTTEVNGYFIDSVKDAVPTTIEQIQKAINDEIQTINLYDDMIEHLDLTEAQLARIKEIRDDENDHLVHLSNMLQTITDEKIEVKDSMKDARLVGSSQIKNEYDMKDVVKQLGVNVKFIESKTLLFGGRGEYYFTIEGRRDDLEKIVKALHLRSSQYGIKDCDKINDAKNGSYTYKNHIIIYGDGDVFVKKNGKFAKNKFDTERDAEEAIDKNLLVFDSTKDKLIDPPASAIEQFERELRYYHVNIVARGRTITGRRHYQVDYSGSPEQLRQVLDKIDKQMDMMNIPMTYAIGSNDRYYSTAGIDLDQQYVKDSDIKDVKEYRIFVNGSERAKWEANSAEEAVKEFMELNPAYANHKKGHVEARDCDIEIRSSKISKALDAIKFIKSMKK